MRVLLLMVFMFSLSCLAEESNPPAPSSGNSGNHPQTHSAKQQNASQSNQAVTSQPPIAINVSPSTNTNDFVGGSRQHYEKETTGKWWGSGEVWIAIFTGLLVIATSILAAFTWKLWNATFGIAEDAKNAAQMAQRIERAQIFMEVVGSYSDETQQISCTVVIKNHGKTPAIITNYRWTMKELTIMPTAIDAELIVAGDKMPPGVVIGGLQERREGVWSMPTNEGSRASQVVFCWGRVQYTDILGKERWTSFCWQFFIHNMRWGVSGNHALNQYE